VSFIYLSIFLLIGLFCQTALGTPLKVVASFSVLGDMISNIGGEAVDVSTIVPHNADPHVYQPTSADACALNSAQLVVINGLGFEGWMTRLIESSGYKGPIVVASEKVKSRILADQKSSDPHAWHDVQNGILYTKAISQALIKLLPQHQNQIEKNTQQYIKKLEALDVWVKAEYCKVPNTVVKVVVTTHDAFSYYGQAYGIVFKSPVGISTEAEPSPQDVAHLIETIRKENIKAIFLENLAKSRLLQEIAKEARGLKIKGELYADSLSDPKDKNSPAKTYIEMIQHNTREIIQALTV
jgi:zinc/manganese transport system substrate-binding protein